MHLLFEKRFWGKDFLKHQKAMLIAMSGTHKKALWVEVILPTAGRQNEWILCWGPYSIWIHFICARPLSSGHVKSGAVADGLFQETTGPKGIPLCCAFSPQTTKAGCGQHTLVKGAKIVSAGCPTDCRQAEERAEQKPRCKEEKNTLLLLEWGVRKIKYEGLLLLTNITPITGVLVMGGCIYIRFECKPSWITNIF